MLNFAKYNSKITPAHGELTPHQFAKLCQQASLSEYMKLVNANSESRGLITRIAGDALEIWIEDADAFRKFLQSLGYPPDVAEHLIQGLSKAPSIPVMRTLKGALNQLKKLCAQLPDCRAMLRDVPIVIGAEPFFNAGASPVPNGGDFIMLNQGIFSAPSWVGGLHRIFWKKEYGISDEQFVEIILDLPYLCLAIMEGPGASATSLSTLQVWIRVRRRLGNKKEWTFDEAFPMLFVILHELGHIKLGHTTEIRSWPSLDNVNTNLKHRLLSQCRRFEFEADAFAAQGILQLAEQKQRVYLGMSFFFALLNTYERQTTAVPPRLRTHPPARDRFREVMKVICPGEDIAGWTSFFFDVNKMLSYEILH